MIGNLILSLAAILISLLQFCISRDKMLKELFTEFNMRYSNLNEHLKFIEDHYPKYESLMLSLEKDRLIGYIQDYINLCSEEFFWYERKKRISKDIYSSWAIGMKYWFTQVPTIKKVWELEIQSNSKKSYYLKNEDNFWDKYC